MFGVTWFSGTWPTGESICKDSNFQKENHALLHHAQKSGGGEG